MTGWGARLGLVAGFLLMFAIAVRPQPLAAQGCVAARFRPDAPVLTGNCTNCTLMAGQRFLSFSYRWLHSDRNFSGDQEDSSGPGSDVSNEIHSFDISASYAFTDRWSASLSLPFTAAWRRTRSEHDGIHRHSMRAGGLGDLRLVTSAWLLDPHQTSAGNLAIGTGFKAPSGDDSVTDIAHRPNGPVVRPVDQSIQPGDGGWGWILELQAYRQFFGGLSGYLSGAYTITPRERNGVQTTFADLGVPRSFQYNSIADQYLARAGFNYAAWPSRGLTLSLGVRDEGVPVHDAIGGSSGFRRPGYAVSVEPAISWSYEQLLVAVAVPVAVYRNRQRSEPEQDLGFRTGDASFADLLVLSSVTYSF